MNGVLSARGEHSDGSVEEESTWGRGVMYHVMKPPLVICLSRYALWFYLSSLFVCLSVCLSVSLFIYVFASLFVCW